MFKFLKARIPIIEFHEGMPEDGFGDENNTRILYVVDDLMDKAGNSKELLAGFIRESHHRECSIIFITQVSNGPGMPYGHRVCYA